MKALDIGQVLDFTCKADRDLPVEERTIFKVKVLSAKKVAELRDTLYKVEGTGKDRTELLKTGTVELKALKIGLVGWENLTDSKGEVVFDGKDMDNMVDRIPPDVRGEIADFVRGEADLNDLE